MSLCDTCSKPGHCCSGFTLNFHQSLQEGSWKEDAQALLDVNGLPFVPISFHTTIDGAGYVYPEGKGYARYSCPKLGEDGRCTIYENRPALCRDYVPATDALCVYFVKEKDDGPSKV